jgi:hypothetical protein
LLNFAHAAREGKFPAALEHNDVFAACRGLNGFDAIQVHNG